MSIEGEFYKLESKNRVVTIGEGGNATLHIESTMDEKTGNAIEIEGVATL